MASGGGPTIVARLHAALAKPLYQRCFDITKILNETSTKELHPLLPILLESIFGFNNQPGWGLGKVSRGYSYDFSALRQLLHPQGALLQLVQRLVVDPYYRYEFPLSCLPFPTQRAIEEGSIPPLYADKLQLNHGGQAFGLVSLNAFEYYFFHFVSFVVNPHTARTSGWTNPSEALYTVLLEEYFNYLLPLDGSLVSPVQHQATSGYRSPAVPQSPASPSMYSTPGRHVTLNRSGLVSLLRSGRTPSAYSSPQPSPLTDHGEPETWRSQTFLQIVVEFWLNQTSLDLDKYTYSHTAREFHSGLQRHFIDPYQYMLYESFLPTCDHVRVVRMLIKHLHYFVNSARPETLHSPYSIPATSAWDDFKRSVLPQLVQKKLYAFLKHGFERWPLDSSFRLILETWLSFLQPWRYTDPRQSNRELPDTRNRVIDLKWRQFVVEHMLFYSSLMINFLLRALRMDLSSAKNAYMLYRVAKVFSLPNLRHMIDEAESGLYEPSPHFATTLGARSPDMGASYLSPTPRYLGNMANAIHLQISDLEGPGFKFIPLFGREALPVVNQLLASMSRAKESAAEASARSGESGGGSFWGWLGIGPMVDYNASRYMSADGYDETSTDVHKVGAHLDQSTALLCELFQMDAPERPDTKTVTWGSHVTKGAKPEVLTPDVYDSDDGARLSPLGRYQMMNGLRKFHVDYHGDPDLQPIRTYEIKFLVRLFHKMTTFLNDRFGPNFDDMYHRDDFWGRCSRVLLTPRVTNASPTQRKALAPVAKQRLEQYSHPHLSLRHLATNQTVGTFIFVCLFLYMWLGFRPISVVLLLLTFTFIYVSWCATWRPPPISPTRR